MQTKNLTPFPFGAKITSRRPGELEMAVVVRGRFRLCPGEPVTPIEGLLEQGPLTGDTFAEDDDERAGELVYPSDFADYKLRAEVMLRGACHVPGKRPLTECPVRFSVGAWSKSLRVVGRRVWTEKLVGQAISDPAPFVTMPIVWANAFGGPDHPDNPVGRGPASPELPTIEHPDAPIRTKASRPAPAGFGPINPAWPSRRGKVGKEYGASYRKTRAPFYAEDFSFSHFSAAPADQQIPGYLRGDEEMSFLNLHPEAPSFSASLPGLRLRVLVKDREERVTDAPMVLDTLHADLEEGLLTLTWRGLVPVKEDDLTDVRTVLIASEKLSERPLPEDHYRAILEAFEADPLERDQNLPKEAKDALALALGEDGKPRAPADLMDAILADQIAAAPPAERGALETSVSAFRGQSKAASASAAARANDAGAVAAQGKAGPMKDLLGRIRELRAKLPPGSKQLEELDAVLGDERLVKLVAPSAEEPRPGADLRGADLSLQDLTGKDLTGADLTGAKLHKTKLAGARLAGANLSQAVLLEADLSGADLSGANLSQAFLNGAQAKGANLRGATLDGAMLDAADLEGADLEGARGQMTMFASARLRGANARGIELFKAISMKGDLEGADFSSAKLTRCVLMEATAKGLVLTGAVLDKTSFAKSDLRGAVVGEISGSGTIWSDALIDGVDFGYARLPDAHFMNASAEGARFFAAVLKNANFRRANLAGAVLAKADLLRCNFNKCAIKGASFAGANLYEASMLGALGERCDFTDANLKKVAHDAR